MSFLGLFSRSHRRRQRARRRLAVAVIAMFGLGAMAMTATAYSRLYVFGENLSEVRNLLVAAGLISPPATSTLTDGTFGPGNPVWAEDLAAHLGLLAAPFTPGGSHLDAGVMARDIDGVLPDGFSLPSIAAQIAAAGAPDPQGLYVIQGANAASVAGGFSGGEGSAATVIAGTGAGSFNVSGSPLTTPLSFDQPPGVFGLPPRGQFVPGQQPSEPPADCTGDNCQQPQPEPQFVCNAPCVPLPPVLPPSLAPACTENCDQLPPEQCLVNCTTPTNACTDDCDTNTPPQQGRITAQVPEPATVALILGGLSVLFLVRQRRPAWARRVRRG